MNPTGSGRFVPFDPSGAGGSPFPAVRFFPFNGNVITIAGVQYQIPAPGIDLYYNDAIVNGVSHQVMPPLATLTIFCVRDALGVLRLEAWQTGGWRTDDGSQPGDLGSGIGIKNGDVSRTVVGMVHTDPNGKWKCDDKSQNTASFYNRVRIPVKCQVSGAETGQTGIGVWVEPNSNNRVSFVCWQDDIPGVVLNGTMTNDGPGVCHTEVAIGVDSNNTPGGSICAWDNFSAGCSNGFSVKAGHDGGMAEGYHWFSVLMSVWSGFGRLRAGYSATWDKTVLMTEQVPS